MEILLLSLLAIAAVLAAALLAGARRWNTGTRELRARLDAARMPLRSRVVDFGELEGLPPPVQRYFRTVLKPGRPMVTGARLRHRGMINMGKAMDRWKSFVSDQKVVTRRPGFDWEGRIAVMPGLTVRVHDAYVTGDGILHAALLGLFSVTDLRGSGDLARDELMRFFAEAAWYPTALLPNQGVRWELLDDRSARGTLTDGGLSTSMQFSFDARGCIDTVRVEDRGRMVDGKRIPTPWRGRFWNYQKRGEMRVPLEAEVAWLLPEAEKPYWRGRITEIDYEFAE